MTKWLTSKTIWAAVGLAVLSVSDYLSGDTPTATQRLLEALSVIGIRHGLWKVQG